MAENDPSWGSPKTSIIPLVIIAFSKKDGGISGCSKKNVPKPERFFDNRYRSQDSLLGIKDNCGQAGIKTIILKILKRIGGWTDVMSGIVRRLPVNGEEGSIELIEIEGIFYLEAQGDDTLIRTKRKKLHKSVQRLGDLDKKLPAPAFVRCHRQFIVNLNRVRVIMPRASRDYDLQLDPPVNRRNPVSRNSPEEIRKILVV